LNQSLLVKGILSFTISPGKSTISGLNAFKTWLSREFEIHQLSDERG